MGNQVDKFTFLFYTPTAYKTEMEYFEAVSLYVENWFFHIV